MTMIMQSTDNTMTTSATATSVNVCTMINLQLRTNSADDQVVCLLGVASNFFVVRDKRIFV